VSLFREAAPSVVLIKTDKGFGSGSILKVNADLRSNPFILTNFHVIGQNREITVVFRPLNPTGAPSEDEVVKAAVVKIDPRRDLALVRPRSLPNREIHPLKISSAEIEVGMDVSAIGHPEGKDWTYTKGVVSAVRPNFEWSYEDGSSHRATIIQTQTPINPGNSGGPLLAVDGSLVGVNSFRATGAEGLNFAVAASEVTAFLQNSADGLEALKVCNQPKTIFEGRKEKVAGFLKMISFHCDDEADIIVVIPDNRRQAVYAVVDFKRRGKPEGIVFDERRSGKWNTSVWDTVLDDTFAMRGIHPDGEFMPKRLVPRCGNRKPLPDLKCS
jgi:hypothetical protein